MRLRHTGVVLLLSAGVAFPGCGSSRHGGPSGLTTGQRKALVAQLETARAAAAAHDVRATTAAIGAFRRSVARLERDGALSAGGARTMRLGALRVLARLGHWAPAPTAPTTGQTTPATAPTTPAPVVPAPKKKPGPAPKAPKPGPKHGHGKGHGHGEGDD